MFVGRVEGLPLGWWVGVKYDEPLGRNDGSVKGKKIFDAPQVGQSSIIKIILRATRRSTYAHHSSRCRSNKLDVLAP